MAKIPSKSFLVIEDIDRNINKIEATSDDKNTRGLKKISLSSILNSLDGILSTDDIITFVTANDLDNLPPVLLRPGRIDNNIYFPNITKEVFQKIINKFFNEKDIMDQQLFCDKVCDKIVNEEMAICILFNNIINIQKNAGDNKNLDLALFLQKLCEYDKKDDKIKDDNIKDDDTVDTVDKNDKKIDDKVYDKSNEIGHVSKETTVSNDDIIIGKVSPIQPIG
jgi:SpoVK/Ycf46/Vps4 family AAA+-type ATPase